MLDGKISQFVEHSISTTIYNKEFSGIKITTIDNLDIMLCEVPVSSVFGISDSDSVFGKYGNYLLVSHEENEFYIGESVNVIKRIKEHIKENKKKFETIYLFLSNSNSFDKHWILYLEDFLINRFKDGLIFKTKKYTFKNSTISSEKSKILYNEKPTADRYTKIILQLLEYTGFESYKSEIINVLDINENMEDEIFHCKNTKVQFQEGKLYILEGSEFKDINIILNDHLKDDSKKQNKSYERELTHLTKCKSFTDQLLDRGLVRVEKNVIKVISKFQVSSPYFAASLAKGVYSTNGWTDFKNKNKTLSDVYRK